QRSVTREHHAPGSQREEFRAAVASARHQGQHEPDRLRTHRAGAARQVRRRAVGDLRRYGGGGAEVTTPGIKRNGRRVSPPAVFMFATRSATDAERVLEVLESVPWLPAREA